MSPLFHMKTKSDWEASRLPLEVYLLEPCEIDKALYLHIGKKGLSGYHTPNLRQCYEAMPVARSYHQGSKDVCFRMTVSKVNEKYFYLGVLPDFKQ